MSWLTWWRKDEKKEEKEEENEKKINIIGEGNVIDNSWFTNVSKTKAFGNYNISIKPCICPVNVTQYYSGSSYYTEVSLTNSQIGIYSKPSANQTFGQITYTFPRLLITNLYSLRLFNPPTESHTCVGVYVANLSLNESSQSYRLPSKASNGSFNTLNVTIEKLYLRSTSSLPTPLQLTETEQIPGLSEENLKYKSVSEGITVSVTQKIQINTFYYDRNIGIVVSGIIPLWVYDKMLPLSTKGFVDSNGVPSTSGYPIVSINDAFYMNVDSSIDFDEREDINLDNFEGFYVKYVRILYTYQEEIEENHTFQYWEDGVLKDSIIKYTGRERKDIASISKTSSNVGNVLTIYFNPQTENDFLDNYIKEEDGNKILEFDMSLTDLDKVVQSLTGYSFGRNLIIVDQMIKKENGNTFTIECCSEQIQGIRVVCTTGTIEYSVYPNYKITNLYCINTNDLNLENELPEINLTILTQKYISLTYNNLYLTNVKASTTYPATNVNLVVSGDITSCYTALPSGVNTINAPPTPGEYLEGESSMDLSNIKELELTRFGELENGVFTNQKIYLSKITVTSGNGDEVEASQMRSSNKAENSNSYALTEIITVIIMDDSIPIDIKTSDDDSTIDENTIRIQLYKDTDVKENDCMQDYVDGNTLNIKLNESLSADFNASKSNLDLYIATIDMNTFKNDEENNKIEFFSDDVTTVSVHYGEGGNTIRTYEINKSENKHEFTTHLGTLNITYTESESDSTIKPITYSSNGNVKAVGLQTKQSGINKIDTVNSINTIVTGNTITNNRITLVNDGLIPKKIYTDILPISETEEHYVDSEGNITSSGIARLVAINEPLKDEYLTYKSSMNLISITKPDDIDINKFGDTVNDVFKQNVFLSEIIAFRDDEIKNKFDNAHLMSRNEQVITGGLGDGEVNYAPTQVRYGNPNLVYNIYNNNSKTWLELNNQNNNNFLTTVTENDKNYTDIYLNRDLTNRENDMSYKFRTLTKYDILVLNMRAMRLCNKNIITFNYDDENETSIDMGNIRVHYYINDTTETYSIWPPSNTTIISEYRVYSVYMIYGNITNDKLEPLNANETGNEIFKKEQENDVTTISINLQEQEITRKVVVNEIYNTNCLIKNVNDLPISTNIVVKGEIPQWVFKEIFPLPTNMSQDGIIINYESKIQLVSINYLPCDFEDLEIGIHLSDNDDICKIDISNVANESVFDKMYMGEGENRKKVFFVNKVTLLERFKGKIDGMFQYYEGTTLKDCVYNEEDPSKSNITYVDDWALKLPECYENCEVSKSDESIKDGKEDVLTVKFREYLQIDYKDGNLVVFDYLFRKLLKDNNYYLDLSMKIDSNLSNIILNNITTLNIYLDILKCITCGGAIKLLYHNKVKIIFNVNGFLESREISEDNVKQEINKCYAIYETEDNLGKLDRDNILIKPASDVFSSEGNIKLHNPFYIKGDIVMQINNLECTNMYQISNPGLTEEFPLNTNVNLLVSGSIPKWLGEYFYSSSAALPMKVKSGRRGLCQLEKSDNTKEVTKEYFMITSINALPAPGIGIANSDPDDQCNLNLEDFMPQPDSGGTGDDGDNPSGGTDPSGNDSTGGDDPSGGSTGD